VAVDAAGSVIFGRAAATRLVPGHGASVRPDLFGPELADEVVHVDDLDCVVGCRRLVRREAVLAGGSSGAVVMGLTRLADRIPAGARCALILPDRGERYLETIYSDEWVLEHFGDVGHLWATD
jgi:cysteine synthase